MVSPWLGFVTPLLVRSATQFAPPPPPALTSARYTRDFNEVKAFGSATSTVRTPAQTDTALFFSSNPLVMFNAALRDQVTLRHLDIVDAARMFAATDMSIADAIISVWHAKYVDGTWRPITAINLADTDNNPATDPDPSWVPLLPNPGLSRVPERLQRVRGIGEPRARECVPHPASTADTHLHGEPPPAPVRLGQACCDRMSSTPGCGWESISASATPPRGTWGSGWPTGHWTTTSSPSRRSDSPTVDRQSAV